MKPHTLTAVILLAHFVAAAVALKTCAHGTAPATRANETPMPGVDAPAFPEGR